MIEPSTVYPSVYVCNGQTVQKMSGKYNGLPGYETSRETNIVKWGRGQIAPLPSKQVALARPGKVFLLYKNLICVLMMIDLTDIVKSREAVQNVLLPLPPLPLTLQLRHYNHACTNIQVIFEYKNVCMYRCQIKYFSSAYNIIMKNHRFSSRQ